MRSDVGTAMLGLLIVAVGCSVPSDSPRDQLFELFDETWEFQMREFPLWATAVGVHDYDDRLSSMTLEDIERRVRYWREVSERLGRIDRLQLAEEDRLNQDLFERQVRDRLEQFEFKEHLIPITAESGFHTAFARLPELVPLQSARDYENYIARLLAFRDYSDQHIALMREGMASGYLQPQVVLEGYAGTIRPHVVDDVSASVFWKPFERFPDSVTSTEHDRLRESGHAAIRDFVVPAYRGYLDFMVDEYIPACRATVSASDLPNGRAYYAYLVRHHTTLDVTPEQVHEIGREEVERIRGEMMAIIDRVGFEGDFVGFLDYLRTAPRFFANSPEELLKEASYIAKQMDGKLPSLFKTLPRLPYTVAPVPDHIALKYTAGRYVGAPLGGTQPGYYWVNTYSLESRPLWALTALTLHEAVPGHHLQNALRQELEGLPNFRRFSGINAYGEGWGLYSEWLGIEAGMYADPYDDFGRLTYEMWRACRLVVDTGLHALGWSRQQAMEFLAAHTALSLHEIETEIDRYISWPGQALAYKMGQLEIMALRRRAEEILGEKFDVREFHDVILLNGPVPLTVLRDQVEGWIESTSSSA